MKPSGVQICSNVAKKKAKNLATVIISEIFICFQVLDLIRVLRIWSSNMTYTKFNFPYPIHNPLAIITNYCIFLLINQIALVIYTVSFDFT